MPPWGSVRKAASRSSVQLTSRAIAGNGGAACLARPPSTRWHWATPAACDILARNRVTRRPHRAVRNNQGTAQRNHRADAVMRPPLTLPTPLLASSEDRSISSSLVENSREAIAGLQTHFLRRRLALALARLCHGAKTVSALSLPREHASADAEQYAARAFSKTIRRYSAAEQRPCAIIHVLRAIVSNEESVMSPIIIGNESVVRLLGRLGAFMVAIWLAARGVATWARVGCAVRASYLVASSLVDAARC